MNLIEQLGGFDKAKQFCENRVRSRKTFIKDGLEEALHYYEMGFNSANEEKSDIIQASIKEQEEVLKYKPVYLKVVGENAILKQEVEKLTEMLFATNDSEDYLYTELGIADRKIKLAIDYISQFRSVNEVLCDELLSILNKGDTPNQDTIDAINSDAVFDNFIEELRKEIKAGSRL